MTGLLNPFVGPRPLERGEKLFGRDRAVRELANLLKAERIVLLCSPSGAGKSSLIQAGLLPRLEDAEEGADFDVWGPTRVSQEPAVPEGNRYVLSALQGFEEGVPESLRRSPEVLAAQTLHQYLEGRPRRRSASRHVLLIFDQFEEVLTVDPLDLEAKQAFFEQLGELLRNPRVWALFALREDYLVPLDPYAHLVPTHLKHRFRIAPLSLGEARQAIVGSAQAGGREIPAADELVRDLATVKVQQSDGSFRDELGSYVEPVQLQVVCFRLWNKMSEDDRSIDPEDLKDFLGVDTALAGYYDDSVAKLSDGDLARERVLREWFSALIPGGIRRQVLRGVDESHGLDNRIVEELLATHLVRAEKRAGATWYELAHDRLIEPVARSNAEWHEEHLSDVQQRAALWEEQGRSPGLLLRDAELVKAERWAGGSAVINPVEWSFLAESRKAQNAVDQERRLTQRIRRRGIAAMIVGALALAASGVAVLQWREADEQARIARQEKQRAEEERDEAARQRRRAEAAKRQEEAAKSLRERAEEAKQLADRLRRAAETEALAGKSLSLKDDADPELKLLLALQAYRLHRRFGAAAESQAVYDALHAALLRFDAGLGEIGQAGEGMAGIHRLATVPGDSALIFGDVGGRIARLRLDASGEEVEPIATLDGIVHDLAVSSTGELVAVSSAEGEEIRVFRLSAEPPRPADTLDGGPKSSVAFRPGGAELAVGGGDGGLRLWDLPASKSVEVAAAPAAPIHALAWSNDGRRLGAGTLHGVLLWDLSEPVASRPSPVHLPGPDPREPPSVRSLAFDAQGRHVAGGTEDGVVLLWNLERPQSVPAELRGHESRVEDLAFHPIRDLLASASHDGSVRLWDVTAPDAEPLLLAGHVGWVWDVAFLGDGSRLISADDEGLRRWATSSEGLAEEGCRHVSRPLSAEEWAEHLPEDLEYETTCPVSSEGAGA